MDAADRYHKWLDRLSRDDPMYKELLDIKGNDGEITDRFYQDIEFGTAGLRGICGAGTNRMNALTVGRATQGIADYINKYADEEELAGRQQACDIRCSGVVIAYDCRYHSREFSELAAEILAGNGICALLFPSLRPTPELSFAIRRLHTISGINMTASHNPKEYNGYKVYWEDGAQISGDVSQGMQQAILSLDLFEEFKRIPLQEAEHQTVYTSDHTAHPLVRILGDETDREYMDYILSMRQRSDSELDLTVPVVYTPLNGAGSIPMRQAARERGFSCFYTVPEQQDPDPDFTTVPYPNPENPAAFELAEKLGIKKQAEVLIATDPDSDRMAVEIAQKDQTGKITSYTALNGNQTGAMLIAYLAESKAEKGQLNNKPAMIKSIVTGDFGRAICDSYGIKVFETLTGFKNICGKIPEIQKEGYTYFFGYEESIGCAPGEAVRDKDGIAAGMLITEMAAYYRRRGMTMADALEKLYERYGYFAEDQVSIVLKGKEGQERIGRIMDAFRQDRPQKFKYNNLIHTAETFITARIIDFIDGWEDIPPQNAMKFVMTDGSWFALRPSGTEPKLKFYFYTREGSRQQSLEKVKALSTCVTDLAQSVQ